MNFQDLLKIYEEQTTITRDNVHDKLYNVPVLHGIFMKYLYQWRKLFLKIDKEKSLLYRRKYYYYKDKYDRVLDEKLIKFHIESDDEFVELNMRYKSLKSEVEHIESMVKHCANLSFFCQNIVNFETFLSGK